MSYTRSYHHIVFGTKRRQKTILPARKSRLHRYIAQTIINKNCDPIKIDGMEEHIHILVDIHPTVALADLVKSVKQSSSKWMSEGLLFPLFEGWASQYYACSVSPSHVAVIKEYIENQKIHHSQKGYEREVRDFVEKMGMVLYQDLP